MTWKTDERERFLIATTAKAEEILPLLRKKKNKKKLQQKILQSDNSLGKL